MMGAIAVGGVCQLPRWIPVKGNVVRIEDAFLTQLQVQTSTIVRSADILVSNDIPRRNENPPERREDHWIHIVKRFVKKKREKYQ